MTRYISIPHVEPDFGGAEAGALYDYVSGGGWLTEFRKTRELEEKIKEFLGIKHCFMVPNGTMALYVACDVLDVTSIAIPDFTMIASPNAAAIAGARVNLIDVERGTLCIPANAAKGYHDAIMPVDLNGRAPDYGSLVRDAKRSECIS